MALSGTLDTFALPDVMRLLASTSKTGRLRVTGQRGSGSVWLEDGAVAMAELVADPIPGSSRADVMFALLRLDTGSFTFEDDVTVETDGPPEPMETTLSTAESMLAEWREIESVVPSMDVWVALRSELDGPDVMVDADRWRGIAAIGAGCTIVAMAQKLSLHEVDVCRLVKELIELGLAELTEPAEELVAEPEMIVDNESRHSADFTEVDERDEVAGAPIDSFAEPEPFTPMSFGDDPSLDPLLTSGDPLSEISHLEEPPSHGSLFSGASSSEVDDEPSLNPAEMARQLANLSPRAAKAVAEAARATTDEEREAALAAVEAEDETVNRSLLLKFLGSVDS